MAKDFTKRNKRGFNIVIGLYNVVRLIIPIMLKHVETLVQALRKVGFIVDPIKVVASIEELNKDPKMNELLNVLREETKHETEASLLGVDGVDEERSFEYENARCEYAMTWQIELMRMLGFDWEVLNTLDKDDLGNSPKWVRNITMPFHEFESYVNIHDKEVMDMFPHRK
jgi:hypothetical protein